MDEKKLEVNSLIKCINSHNCVSIVISVCLSILQSQLDLNHGLIFVSVKARLS